MSRRPVSDEVFHRLLGDVVGLEPGDALPSERTLSERLGVNRHAVREALKRLQQAGLVEISQGGATRVRDWRRTAGLDLLPLLAVAGRPAPEFVVGAAEMRLTIGADAARLCAERATADARARLKAFADRPPAARDDPFTAYAALWEAIVDGSGNVTYRLALNSLMAGMATLAGDGEALDAAEVTDADAQRALASACVAGQVDAAERRARDLLARGVAAARASG